MLPFYAAHAVPLKITGNLLPTAAFRTPGELPVYGSSELDNWAVNRADAFFRHRPTGFAVFTVGRGGGSCLSILQKLAAAGAAAHGKRVVIFLSPAWFVENEVEAAGLDADLGTSQMGAWIFDGELSPSLRTAVATRMRDFPGKVKNQALLDDALRCLARPTPSHRLGFTLLTPLGHFQNALLGSLESCAILWQTVVPQRRWRREGKRDQAPPPVTDGQIDWQRLEKETDGPRLAAADDARALPMPTGAEDGMFVARLASSREFDDLALLIRVLKEMKMEAYFIGQPLNGPFRDRLQISAAARRVYYARVEAVLRAGGYPWHDFSEHEQDADFFSDVEHPSAEAWLFYDRAIDRFYSGGED